MYSVNHNMYLSNISLVTLSLPSSEDLLIIVRPDTLKVFPDLVVVAADMLAVPSIRTPIVIGESGLETFKRHVCRTHYGLPHVVEAVDHVPVVIVGQFYV